MIKLSKTYPLSVHQRKIVSICFPKVWIAWMVLSGVVEIASSIQVMPAYVHIFSILWGSHLNVATVSSNISYPIFMISQIPSSAEMFIILCSPLSMIV
ncbi:TPA: hypothetical protein DCZ39_05395 [Patescibacteria group bacterium]|nr:hypothetical protein [Candidatus Gracilibacteria bacterium]